MRTQSVFYLIFEVFDSFFAKCGLTKNLVNDWAVLYSRRANGYGTLQYATYVLHAQVLRGTRHDPRFKSLSALKICVYEMYVLYA